MREYIVSEAASMIGALVTGENIRNIEVIVEYKCSAAGEWIRFAKDPPDEWRDLNVYNIISKKERKDG